MSMHFAPQWTKPVKPTKPTASTADPLPNRPAHTASQSQSNVPFPALTTHTSTTAHHNPALSYSRATHTPVSPHFPDAYFPPEPNGHAGDGRPFRYSKDQILGQWDEEKVKEVPIELVDLVAEGVLVSQSVVKPFGLREVSEAEKKLLATSVHPPIPPRRPVQTQPETVPARRTLGPPKDSQPNGRPLFGFGRGEGGAFGRGEGGAFAGKHSNISAAPSPAGDTRAPGLMGGGFGGVGRRVGRRPESGDAGASPWRSTRTASGTFEGVLGFGAAANTPSTNNVTNDPPHPPPVAEATNLSARGGVMRDKGEPAEKDLDTFGSGGGPGWGTGVKKWRLAAGQSASDAEKPHMLNVPISTMESTSESIAATASGTPLPERDATVLESTPVPGPRPWSEAPAPPPQTEVPPVPPVQEREKEDLGSVQWYYRDPDGNEQGPFVGSQMHDWYSHAYFDDHLPLRRSAETAFHTLAELKAATGNAVQPFLAAVRPRNPPPNLPVPAAAMTPNSVRPNNHANGITDAFRNLGLTPPALTTSNARVSPASVASPPAQPFNHLYPDRNAFSPNQFTPPSSTFSHQQQLPSPAGPYMPSSGQGWMAPGPANIGRMNQLGPMRVTSPIGPGNGYTPQPFQHPQQSLGPQQHQTFSPVIGGPIHRDPQFFSPSVGVGAVPPSPWRVPPPQHAAFGQAISPLGQAQQAHRISPPTAAWQHGPPIQQPLHTEQPPSPAREPSYFPPQELYQDPGSIQREVDGVSVLKPSNEQEDGHPDASDDEVLPEPETRPETPVQTSSVVEAESIITSASTKPPATSVWGQKASAVVRTPSVPSSRKSSIAVATIPAAPPPHPAKLPPAPASLPAKPVTLIPETTSGSTPTQKQAVKAAPWGEKDGVTTVNGPSLREIQEKEAQEVEARRIARPVAASPAPTNGNDEFPTSMTWGLPSSQKGSTSTPMAASAAQVQSPAAPVWGGGEAGPKKTMKQIQEEEERRRANAGQAKAQGHAGVSGPGAVVPGQKRGYADLAAVSQPPGAGWMTVGTKGLTTPGVVAAVRPAAGSASPRPAPPAAKSSTPLVPSLGATKAKAYGSLEDPEPSVDFIRWAKGALTGLKINVDEFIQMLLSFPIDPPASSRAETLEIISDSVYANSSTLDGKHFAQEFMTKRKADAARPRGAGTISKSSSGANVGGSLADVVKSVPKKSEDAGFRVVKAKGKKKT